MESKSAISQKAEEIMMTLQTITDLMPEDIKMLQFVKDLLMNNIIELNMTLSYAEKCSHYDVKMESATLIRRNAKSLLLSYHALKLYKFSDVKYFELVKEQLHDFRLLFREWVSNFDLECYTVDNWGLFNPPGVSPDDHDEEELDFMTDRYFTEKLNFLNLGEIGDEDEDDEYDEEDEDEDEDEDENPTTK